MGWPGDGDTWTQGSWRVPGAAGQRVGTPGCDTPRPQSWGTLGRVSRISPGAGVWLRVREAGSITQPLVTLPQVVPSLVVTPYPNDPVPSDPLPLVTTALLVTPSPGDPIPR